MWHQSLPKFASWNLATFWLTFRDWIIWYNFQAHCIVHALCLNVSSVFIWRCLRYKYRNTESIKLLGCSFHQNWFWIYMCTRFSWLSHWYRFLPLKGTLDKYNIYLFISNSLKDFKLNQYQNFQLILPLLFHFMRYFVNSIIFGMSHRLLYCVFIEVDFETRKCHKYPYFFKSKSVYNVKLIMQSLPMSTLLMV